MRQIFALACGLFTQAAAQGHQWAVAPAVVAAFATLDAMLPAGWKGER